MSFDLISQPETQSPSRRRLLKKLGIAGIAGATFAGRGLKAETGPSLTDVLQFALNIEYLEAEFYTMATTGKSIEMMGISTDGQGTAGPTRGGGMVNFANNFVFSEDAAVGLAADERAHVLLLRAALQQAGVTPVAKPEIDLNALGSSFDNELEFLTAARTFEDLGVSATAGAAAVPSVSSSFFIGTLARIIATEAEHVGNLRLQAARLGIVIKPLDGVDIVPPPAAGGKLFSNDSDGLVAVRTPGQILFLAYGMQANAKAGGFFPSGVNGSINTSSGPA